MLKSIDHAKSHDKFVAVNYLNCPGFTDTQEEMEALANLISKYQIDMIQWRNLNFDPVNYHRIMKKSGAVGKIIGMEKMIRHLTDLFPNLIHGYFNPPREKYLHGVEK